MELVGEIGGAERRWDSSAPPELERRRRWPGERYGGIEVGSRAERNMGRGKDEDPLQSRLAVCKDRPYVSHERKAARRESPTSFGFSPRVLYLIEVLHERNLT